MRDNRSQYLYILQKQTLLFYDYNSLLTTPSTLTFIQPLRHVPNRLITELKFSCHENTIVRDERTYRVVCFEGGHSMLPCKEKCEILHESFLLVRHQSRFHAIALSK